MINPFAHISTETATQADVRKHWYRFHPYTVIIRDVG